MTAPRPAPPTMITDAIPRAERTARGAGGGAIGCAIGQYLVRPSGWTAVQGPVMFQIGPDARAGKRHRHRADHVLLRNPRFAKRRPRKAQTPEICPGESPACA